ncbi:MAG: DUF58 domain-containing protein [Myxococcales bacterium]|nr:DUF58 domain-containing protein [Myxococcales bacterium]
MTPGETAARACERYRLRRDLRRVRGDMGQIKGVGVGSSVEFHDYRRYLPGDDPRHVDWAVYGRTGELNVRLFHEEVHPSVDVLLDASRSMAIADGRKRELALELADFVLHSARLQGSRARLHLCGTDVLPVERIADVALDAPASLLLSEPARCAQRLRRGSMVVVISDFMATEPPSRTLLALGQRAAQLVALRTLGPWEAAPEPSALATLEDAEAGAQLATALGPRAIEDYLGHLHAIEDSARQSCRALGGVFVPVTCDRPLTDVLRTDLLPAAVVEPV